MKVVRFPDEIHRLLIEDLESKLDFLSFLNVLEYCLKKDLDILPIMPWWRNNRNKLKSENLEAEFCLFLEGLSFSKFSKKEEIEEQKRKEAEEVKRKSPYKEDIKISEGGMEVGSASNFDIALYNLGQAFKEIGAEAKREAQWRRLHPRYECLHFVPSVLDLFDPVYKKDGPLEVIADFFNEFRICGHVSEENEEDFNGAEKKIRSRERIENSLRVVFGSHQHKALLEISKWVSERSNPDSQIVYNYIMGDLEGIEKTPHSVVVAATKSTHALFRAFMNMPSYINTVETLTIILKLPQDISPDPYKEPHLTPEFEFLGGETRDGGWYEVWRRQYKWRESIEWKELAAAWRKFFINHKTLRVEKNQGRFIEGMNVDIFGLALETLGYEDQLSYDQSVRYAQELLNPDLFIVLQFINTSVWFDFLFDKEEGGYLMEFTGIFLPVISQAHKEGCYELSNNLLAFYLLLAGVANEGNLDEIDDVYDLIGKHKWLPGYHNMRLAIDAICKLAKNANRQLTYERLDQFRKSTDGRVGSLIQEGEGEKCELKSTLRMNLNTGIADKRIEHSALKTVAGFLNKHGGTLLIGIDDDGNVVGIEKDGLLNKDKYGLHFKNLLKQTMPKAMDYISYTFSDYQEHEIFVVDCQRSKVPVFYQNREQKREEFYVRRGASTDSLSMSETVNYIQKNFSSKI